VAFLVNDVLRWRRSVSSPKRLVAVSVGNAQVYLSSLFPASRLKWKRLLIPSSSLRDNGARPAFCGFRASFGPRLIRESRSPRAIKRSYNRGKNIRGNNTLWYSLPYTGCLQVPERYVQPGFALATKGRINIRRANARLLNCTCTSFTRNSLIHCKELGKQRDTDISLTDRYRGTSKYRSGIDSIFACYFLIILACNVQSCLFSLSFSLQSKSQVKKKIHKKD